MGEGVLYRAAPEKVRFAIDSPVEGAGFEPSVPRSRKGLPFWRRGVGRVTETTRGGPETVST